MRYNPGVITLPRGFRLERIPAVTTIDPSTGRPPATDPYRSPGRVRDDLVVEWPWYHRKQWFVLGFALCWWVFLVIWYTKASLEGDIYMLVFPLVHVIVGLVLLYISLAIVCNRTRLMIQGDVFEFDHGPVPWPGKQRLASRAIMKLYCKEEVSYHSSRAPVMMYAIHVRLHDGKIVKLPGRFGDPEVALHIEEHISDCLGIADPAAPPVIVPG